MPTEQTQSRDDELVEAGVGNGHSNHSANSVPQNPTPGITRTPGVCGGDPCIERTRYAVWLLYRARQLGASDQELLEQHPDLTPRELENAWRYADSHVDEMEQSIRKNEDW